MTLKGLPPVDPRAALPETPAIDKARFCDVCGKEARIVSNSEGVEAYCGPCKRHWPISSTPLSIMLLPSLPRGLEKRVLVEPEWNRAFEEERGDPLNDQIGPKRK